MRKVNAVPVFVKYVDEAQILKKQDENKTRQVAQPVSAPIYFTRSIPPSTDRSIPNSISRSVPLSATGDGISGFRIYKDQKLDTLSVRTDEGLPVIRSDSFRAPIQGGILYEPISKQIFYADGTQWIPLTPGGGGGGNSTSYSLIKSGEQTILPLTTSILTNFSITPNPPYHDLTGGWNIATGVYTATASETVFFDVDLSWKSGVSNLGNRTLRIIYKPVAAPAIIAKEDITQADPNTNVKTTQQACIFLKMEPGDKAWLEVFHTSNVNLIVATGNPTSVTGLKLIL